VAFERMDAGFDAGRAAAAQAADEPCEPGRRPSRGPGHWGTLGRRPPDDAAREPVREAAAHRAPHELETSDIGVPTQ